MEENHEQEQYFYCQKTIDRVADILEHYEHPCVVCAPLVGIELAERGIDVVSLDIDPRFQGEYGFHLWNLHRPQRIEDHFDVIFCDPPIFKVSLGQMFQALRLLAQFNFDQHLAITYLERRKQALLGTFSPFGLKENGVQVTYRTAENTSKNKITLFTNFEIGQHNAHH